MSPDDPRHGTWAGYNAGCRAECCREAARNYQKRLHHDHVHGHRRTVDIVGTRRRLRALMRVGWSAALIGEHVGVGASMIQGLTSRSTIKVINRRTHERILAVYEELSGRIGPSREAVKHATRLGYASPLAWEYVDMDDPAASPVGIHDDHRSRRAVDEVAIVRRMAGDRTVKTHGEESAEVVRRLLAAGYSHRWIAEHTGLKVDRYLEAVA